MRRNGFALFTLILVLTATARAAVNVGDSPELAFRTLSGQDLDLKQLRGKLVLVDFWATWCGPCMAEAGHMVEVHKKYNEKGLQIIGISLDQNRSKLESVVKEQGFDWPQFFDGKGWDNRFAKAWGVQGIPKTFLIDPSGKVAWSGHPAAMDQAIEKAFAETPPQLVDPALAQAASTTLEQIEAAIKSGDSASAIKQFAAIPAAARKDAMINERAKAAEEQLAAAAAEMLAQVEPMIEQKQFAEAAAKLKELGAALGTTDAGNAARKRLSELNLMPEAQAQFAAAMKDTKANDELAIAQRLQGEGKNEEAYVRFKQIAKQFPDTQAATTAAEAIKTYEQDPDFAKRAMETAAAGKAKNMLSLAQSYQKSGRADTARKKYQEIIDTYPGTSFAAAAEKALKEMK